ncbi:ribosome maturation factor RimM [Sphingosinicella sp. LHD-64]|uniref:ribosome maturation factor RimM n=1 Tax=Sphingosinicella sp. LHD-64 TaxID=3072139 RepID=UPI002810304D|nr:ribosome maturation factor RimM [Sphingosinicella sp. LHD-64]MDQ8755356.1 ribosome maturation factor RimM [Sphingosinicella sp. LHD-64]
MKEPQVILAAVAGAHGIGGEVRLKIFAESVDSLKAHKRLFAGERALTLKSVKPGSNGAIARFAEIADRSAAEALRGQALSIPRTELPPLDEDEYYHADLIGRPCIDAAGKPLGVVVAVENFGAGDLLEIEKPDGKSALIPFRPGIADPVDGGIVADPAFLA